MLRFLLDEHISPKVSKQLQQKEPLAVAYNLQTWQQGQYLGTPDELIIEAAYQHALTLVTYDLKTIPPLLTALALAQQNHAGIIFVATHAIAPQDIGGLVKALTALWQKTHTQNWENRCHFLKKQS